MTTEFGENPVPRIVTVAAGVFIRTLDGQMLVMIGCSVFTRKVTLTTWVLFVAGTPVAVIVSFPENGVADAASSVASGCTDTVTGAPGNTTPVEGDTVIQVAPEAIVK